MHDLMEHRSHRISELEAKVAALEKKLNYDDLTGAFTRQYLFNEFSKPVVRSGFLIFMDMDDFKSVNDYYGHQAGDHLLKLIAQALIRAVGRNGFVVRISGDEFVVAVDKMAEDDFLDVVEAIRREVRTAKLTIGSLEVSRTASLGFVKLDMTMDVSEAMSLADSMLIQAKFDGKNRSRGFQRGPQQLSTRLPSVDAVRRALRENEIGYHVQPVLRASDLKIEGYEALLRWSLPSGEVIGPSQFLETMTQAYDPETRPPLAAARETSEWAVFKKSKYISFNISEAFIMRIAREGSGWVDEIVGGIPLDRIVFELLETVVDRKGEYVADAVAKLRKRGIRVALDDFGTAHSSLERLQGLDVDFVKIDKRFIHGASLNNRGLDIFASMVELSHRLGAQTVVEGIETAEQLELAQQVGTDFLQGYFLGRPKPIKDYD